MKIEIKNLTKQYPKSRRKSHLVLKDISFTIESGDFVIILGESGCGKTTLLNLLAGLERADSGEILQDGRAVEGMHPSRSMLFQQPALLPWLSVRDNVAYGCRLRRDTEELEYRVNQFIEIMGLTAFADARPDQLSLGMAQRTCLARALVGHPEALLLDEPFASLDTFTQAHIQEELINLWLSEKFTAIFVTHDIDEAIKMGNKIILLAGQPTNISEFIEIPDAYPRDLNQARFKELRQRILDCFKDAYLAKRSLI